ncbi:RidA family protein [Candidatus Latescibacterota bacterium]
MGDHLPDGKHPATFEEQVRQAMKNAGEVLREAGLDFRHVVSTQVYLDNYDNYNIANKVYSEFFEYGNEPARATVFVDMIPNDTHVAIACVATTDLSSRKVVRPANRKYGPEERAPTASPGVWAGEILYISGQDGRNPETGLLGSDLKTQFDQMIRNQLDVLESAGLEIDNVVKSDIHLKILDHYRPMNEIYINVFSVYPPTRITLQMNSGHQKGDVLVETIFVAARGKKE